MLFWFEIVCMCKLCDTKILLGETYLLERGRVGEPMSHTEAVVVNCGLIYNFNYCCQVSKDTSQSDKYPWAN